MKQTLRMAGLALSAAALLALSACGGDDAAAPAASTTSVPVTVVDGAVRNALVCVDKNSNGLCDAGETSGRTDAAGNVSLQVPNEDAGKYPILAIVGTDAVDADHGAVTVAYTMTAPADQPAVVSPLTTLVQTMVASTGVSSSAAEASVKAQTGLTVSLFQDFTKSSTAASAAAGTVARMVVVVTQQQNEAIKGAVGTAAIDGKAMTKADLDEAVQRKLLEILPAVVAALNDPSVTGATTPAAKEAALLAKATAIVADPATGLTTASVATAVAINNQAPATTAEAPAASLTLATFSYVDANNWYSRSFATSLSMAAPDASGNTLYQERRARSTSGTVTRWNSGSEPSRQADLHFNGTAWVSCGLNTPGTTYKRDASGNSDYDYCDKLETGRQARATFDIAGRTIASVYAQIRDGGYTNITLAGGTAAIASSATFPANSKLYYQTNTPLTAAPAYYPGLNSVMYQYAANVAAGRTNPSVAAPCSATSPAPSSTPSTTLEGLIAANPGTPCAFPANADTGARNEAWGFSSLGAGIAGGAPVGSGSSYYTTNTALRVAFSGTTVKYLQCQQRNLDGSGSNRNCDVVGTGTYTITTMGDARVLSFNDRPGKFAEIQSPRVFVQRGGKVYSGYRNPLSSTSQARLNLPATNALFASVGVGAVPDISSSANIALSIGNYVGDWLVFGSDGGSELININSAGGVTCTFTDPGGDTGNDACTMPSFNPATGAFTINFEDGGVATGTFNYQAATVNLTVTGPGAGAASGTRR